MHRRRTGRRKGAASRETHAAAPVDRPPEENLRLLVSPEDRIPTGLAEGLLNNERIPFVTKNETALFPPAFRGSSPCTEFLYVDAADFDRARELVRVYLQGPDDPPAEKKPGYGRKRALRIGIILTVLSPLILVLLVMLIARLFGAPGHSIAITFG